MQRKNVISFVDNMLTLFKGQLSYKDILDMPYADAVRLRDVRAERLDKERKAIEAVKKQGAPGGALQGYEEMVEELGM